MSTAEEFYAMAAAQESEGKSDSASWESRIVSVPSEWYTTTPPPREWLLRDARTENKEGVFPLGKVGLIAAAGGSGKTMAVTQLALAKATGGTWLGAFDAGQPGKVLLALGEEDAQEMHRRIYRAAREAGKAPPENSLIALPLAGMPCRMVDGDDDTEFLVWFRDYLKRTGPYALVILDPVSRFASADMEKDNAAATRFVIALESLIEPSGGGSILGSHHTNQSSRKDGAPADMTAVRGVSAIVDGTRWVSVVQVERTTTDDKVESLITLAMAKSNYSMFAAPVVLRYGEGGVLVPMSADERQAAQQARDEARPSVRRERAREEKKAKRTDEIDATVIAIVRENPGIGSTKLRIAVKARSVCSSDSADVAIARVTGPGKPVYVKTEGKTAAHYVREGAHAESNDTKPVATGTNGVHGTTMVVDDDNEAARMSNLV